MSLVVTRSETGYQAVVSPPHGERWSSPSNLTPTEVLTQLEPRGCDYRDVSDALDSADFAWVRAGNPLGRPWAEVHDAEVIRRRAASDIRQR